MARKPATITTDLTLTPGELTDVSKWQRAERGFAIIDISLPDGVRIPTLVSVYNIIRGKETAGFLLLRDEAIEQTRLYALHLSGVKEPNCTRYATPSEVFDRLERSCGTLYLRATGHIGNDEQISPDFLTAEWMDVPIEFEPTIIAAEYAAGQESLSKSSLMTEPRGLL